MSGSMEEREWPYSHKDDKRRFSVSCDKDNLVVGIKRQGETEKKPRDRGGRTYPLE